MQNLNKSKFTKTISIPYLLIPNTFIGRIVGVKSVKSFTIAKTKKFMPIMKSENTNFKALLFDPNLLNELCVKESVINDIQRVVPEKLNLQFQTMSHTLEYDDWDVKSCLKAILPPGLEFSGYSQVGHIAHLNLREEILPFKFSIAQILLDKVAWVKTVVNKLNAINNEFRFFEMELLAGEANYMTNVIERGIKYKLDFSKVFWNSRLFKVHNLVIERFNNKSIVFDIFAGVGPFVLPAIKLKNAKKCFANDLNSFSIKYLNENIELNKVPKNQIETFNLDGSDFIRNILPKKFAEFAVNEAESNDLTFHVIMNLPCLSVEFLKYFKGCLSDCAETIDFFKANKFIVYCHLFVKAHEDHPREWFEEEARNLVKDRMNLPNLKILESYYIRKVATFKEMFCVIFQLPADYAYAVEAVPKDSICTENIRKRNIDLIVIENDDCNLKNQRFD